MFNYAHIELIEDKEGNLIDTKNYCSDFCHKESNKNYEIDSYKTTDFKGDINDYQLIVIPSMRTPQKIIDLAKNYFGNDQIIITKVDKKAYLSSLKI